MRGGYRHRRVGMKKKERERNRANTRGAAGNSMGPLARGHAGIFF